MVEDFVRHYGYGAVALGALAEGETVLLLAGYGAHRGWLEWPWVVLVAALAATLGDQFFFFLGRWFGPQLVKRFSGLEKNLPRVQRLLHRGAPWAIVSVRFLYGLRIAGPDTWPMAAAWFHRAGVQRLFLSLGDQGIFYSDGECQGHLPVLGSPVVNVTGGGDAFMAGLAHAWLQEQDIVETTRFALGCAAVG